ncbi:MAG: hypothetical protein K9G40_07620 [Crocinitomicaceae bacterium]|nr:hypothetical protein [Crocinitomicaceae bacterium]MCF8434711.1 hypothetical protein [Crocinitomicaceae bacterium]
MKIIGLTLVTLVFAASCKKQTINKIENSIVEGEWKVSLYEDDGNNETSDYTDYRFKFNTDGSVTVQPGMLTVTYAGTWKTEKDSDHVDFILNFATPANLEDLSDDWEVLSESKTKLELEDVSGGDGSIDKLTFEKI